MGNAYGRFSVGARRRRWLQVKRLGQAISNVGNNLRLSWIVFTGTSAERLFPAGGYESLFSGASMRGWIQFQVCLAWLAAIGAVGGCDPRYYRSETTLHDDGRVDRAIYQERNQTPAEALRPDVWTKTTAAPRIDDENWEGSISALPVLPADQEQPYIAAWGRFDHPSKLPVHFLRKGAGELKGTLARDYARRDYGFVVEHRWKETLTDVVTLEDMRRATDELAELCIAVGRDALVDAYGTDYEFGELIKWFQTEGVAWFHEATDLFYDLGARRELKNESWELAFARICARRGLQVLDDTGVPLPADAQEAVRLHFVRSLLYQKVRTKGGKAPASEVVEAILTGSGLMKRASKPDSEEPGDEPPSQLSLSEKKVIDQNHGGQAAFEARFSQLATRIMGLYHFPPLQPPERFTYRLKVPGTIVATTGSLLSPQEVEWTFEAKDAFPLGYAMECRSLSVRGEVQQKLLGRTPLQTQDHLQKFVAILANDAALNRAVQACIAENSLLPLRARANAVKAGSAEYRRVWQMFRLLGLPDMPPKKKKEPAPDADVSLEAIGQQHQRFRRSVV